MECRRGRRAGPLAGVITPFVGDPAVVDVSVGRPVALRPHLSMGLPLSTPMHSCDALEGRQRVIDRMARDTTNGRRRGAEPRFAAALSGPRTDQRRTRCQLSVGEPCCFQP